MGSGTELTERKIRSILTILVLGCYEKEEAATKGVARWNGIIWMKKADGQDDQTKKRIKKSTGQFQKMIFFCRKGQI